MLKRIIFTYVLFTILTNYRIWAAPAGPDLDGNPGIAGGTVDFGAYEYESPVSQISYACLQQYGLPINSATDTSDPDGDAVVYQRRWIRSTIHH